MKRVIVSMATFLKESFFAFESESKHFDNFVGERYLDITASKVKVHQSTTSSST